MSDDLKHFKVSAGLKNIIGNELITDDFVAVFELVKNSFDAHAKRVVVRFENLRQPDLTKTSLVIRDDGKGMTQEDIRSKWLWVGYSAKKHNTEDEGIGPSSDYRELIGADRPFAGAKGIGRFSCDRLGRYLRLLTRRDPSNPAFEWLMVDWKNFEDNDKTRFEDVEIEHDSSVDNPFGIERGTALEITNLRKIWTREDLLKLKKELQKLITPIEGEGTASFEIIIEAPEEEQQDKSEKDEDRRVNGPVRNFLFERLRLKTTQLVCQFSDSGKTIETNLLDHDRLIYRLVEQNSKYSGLRGVTFRIFYLNRAAKLSFRETLGVAPIEFGSIFVYKNGFRVQPYGSENDDSFLIDRRKIQGTSRYLGSRDLVGRIEVKCDNSRFKEASSRNAGFIESTESEQLGEYVLIVLRRLEAFVVDVIRWGNPIGEGIDPSLGLTAPENRDAMLQLVGRLTDSKEIVNFEVGKDLIKIVSAGQAEGAAALLANFERLASEQSNPQLGKEARRIRREMEAVLVARSEAEVGEARERERAKRAEQEARVSLAKAQEAEETAKRAIVTAQDAQYRERQLDTQNVFLKAVLSKDFDHVLSLHHSIAQDALTIELDVFNAMDLLKDESKLKPELIRIHLERISNLAKRIGVITRFATQANHLAAQEEIPNGDLVEFVREYLLNVYHGFVSRPDRTTIPIRFRQAVGVRFVTTFAPIDITMIFDNLISNARKPQHKVKHIDVSIVNCAHDKLVVSFCDDGVGIPKRNLPHLFEMGFSTTDGSGLGLRHTKEILIEMGGAIQVAENRKEGAEFILTFPAR